MAMAGLELRLFGRFQARSSSGRSVELATRKTQALLAYLALQYGRAQSREKLIALLWSDRAQKQGRDSLRQALTALRKGLGSECVALLTVDGDAIAVEPTAVLVDAVRFEQLLAGGTARDLEGAVDLYQGDLLDGIGVRDPAFEYWLQVERQRLHEKAVDGLAKVLAHQLGAGASDRVLATATRLLQLDPLDEIAHRALIRLHAEQGRRALALRQYQACVDVLKRELGIAPEPETVALDDAIRRERRSSIPRPAAIHRLRSNGNASGVADEGGPDGHPRALPAIGRPAERRHLTIMLVGLVGSTAPSTRLDPEQMRDLLGDWHQAVAQAAARFEGQVTNVLGADVLVAFGWPRAHEDDAERAIRAAFAVRASVGALRRPDGQPMALRIGIASGLVVVGAGLGDDALVVGDPPNLVVRLQALATPGQIVIAESTRRLLGNLFGFADLGHTRLEGIGEPVRRFAVTGERATESRFEARSGPTPLPMVGRDQELALLLQRWALAKAGEGQGVLLIGTPGIGKSRIVRALLDATADQPQVRIRYQCSPYHTDSSLWPVIQQLIHAAGIAATDSSDAKLDRLEALLAQAAGVAAAPLIASLVGLDGERRYGSLDLTPQAQRARTLEALVDQVLGLAAQQPVLVVLEDAHWIDPTTLELIEQGLERIANARVLVLLTSRPDRQPALVGHPHITQLTLNRLGRAAVEAIVAELGGDRTPPAAVIDAIVARTDGVPLFVEELTKVVLESGLLTEGGDRFDLAAPGPSLAIPATLHDSLMARLDRLAPVRDIAQIGAVVGREFSHELIAALADRPDDHLANDLERLVAAELIFRRGTPPHASYVFKHALVQQAAYQSLLEPRRRQLHGRIAEALQDGGPGLGDAAPETVAHHLTAAGATAASIGWWRQAGDQARLRFANPEALLHHRRALDLLNQQPPSAARDRLELELRVDLRGPLTLVEGYNSALVEHNGLRVVELCRTLNETRGLFRPLYDLQRHALQSADFGRALGHARELVALGERSGDRPAEICGELGLGSICMVHGELSGALGHYERGMELDRLRQQGQDPAPHFQPAMTCRALAALTLWMLGHPDRASQRMATAVEAIDRVGTPFIVGFALHRSAVLHHYRRDPGTALAIAQRFLDLAEVHPMPHWLPWLLVIRAWARAAQGAHEAALADLGQAWPLWSARRSEIHGPYLRCVAAEVHLAVGQARAGLAILDQALAVSARTGERHWLSEVHRIRGHLLRPSDGSAVGAAGRCFEAALEEARHQSARLLELRAAVDLARLWAQQDQRLRAVDLLAPVYDGFSEGFDTADLGDAKTLLDQLT